MVSPEDSKRQPRPIKRNARRAIAVVVGQDITCPTQVAAGGRIRIRSERAAQVARWFGLGRHVAPRPSSDNAKAATNPPAPPRCPTPPLRPGTITLVAGPSGAGKSTLLRAARDAHPTRRWIDLARASAPDAPLVDCFDDLPLRDALALLARVGLGEAWTYLRTPDELSEGQRWRFRLALALHAAARDDDEASPVIVCDEFAAVLDRVTAIIVAHRLRRAIDAFPRAAAVVATSHEDVEPALAAEVVVRCDFGREGN